MTESKRILIIEDNFREREVLRDSLESKGYVVDDAPDSATAGSYLRSNIPDLILLDLGLPNYSGSDLLSSLKSDARTNSIPIIIVTAIVDPQKAIEHIRLGADDYLTKPVNNGLLNARVQNALQRRDLQKQAAFLQAESDRNVVKLADANREIERLLRNIIPGSKIDELKTTKTVRPERYENVGVLFSDVKGFTDYCGNHEPEIVVQNLQKLTVKFEDIVRQNGLEKIKTIGDGFMATANLLLASSEDPVANCVRCGLQMCQATDEIFPDLNWKVRIGVHVGAVVAGILGRDKFQFDLWGQTVNTAARVESNGTPGFVCVSEPAWERVKHLFRAEAFVKDVKGIGSMTLYRILGEAT